VASTPTPDNRGSPLLRRGVAWAVVIAALLAAGLLLGVVGKATHDPASTDDLPEGYDSTTVAALLEDLPAAEGSVAVVLFAADDGELSQAELERLTRTYVATRAPASTPASGSASGTPAAGAHNDADVAFATGMIPHHGQALTMADMALNSAGNAEVKALAEQIKKAQDPEIQQMSG
jgi:hypothetical protein